MQNIRYIYGTAAKQLVHIWLATAQAVPSTSRCIEISLKGVIEMG